MSAISESFIDLKKRIAEIEEQIFAFEEAGANGKQTARDIVSRLTSISEAAERVATDIADSAIISLNVGDYGYGRTYYPKGHEYWSESRADDYGAGDGYWLSSSDMC